MPRNTLDLFKVNADAERDGVWYRVSDEAKDGDPDMKVDFWVRVRRLGNSDYEQAMKKRALQEGRRMRHTGLNLNKADEIQLNALANHVLVDWKNYYEDGKEIPYTPEKCRSVLLAAPDLRRLIEDVATDVELFKDQVMSEQEGNSESGTAGNSTTETAKSS